jgi:hypothetical protein
MALSLVDNGSTASAIADVKKSVRDFVGRTHPAALVAWFLVAVILFAGILFTGYHNWNLFARGAKTDFAQILAAVPPLMLDGSIAILCVLLLTYFKDPLQWWVAVLFNVILFVIVGFNTSLDYSLTNNETLSDGLRVYLRWGVLGSFLLAFALWEVIIHLDPRHKRQAAKGRLELQAEEDAHRIELELIQLDILARQNDLAYQKEQEQRKHQARMNALKRDEIAEAWNEFEDDTTEAEAERIRQEGRKAGGPKRPKA